MRTVLKNAFWMAALAAALVVAPFAQSRPLAAQELKPMLVVSVAGVQEILNDVDYVTRLSGSQDMGQFVKLIAGAYTVGIDKTKPAGVVVTSDGAGFTVLGFLPVSDLKVQLAALKDQFGEPKDAGNGIQELDGPVPTFIKEQAGWVFFSHEAKNLANLPQEPRTLLGNLDKKYDLGVRVHVQNIPAPFRQMALTQLRSGFREGLGGLDDEDSPEARLKRKVAENQLKQFEALINETDQLTLGWSIDSVAKSTYLDMSVTFLPGTKSSQRMAAIKDTRSSQTGFLMPDAALNLSLMTNEIAEEDALQVKTLLQEARTSILKEIDEDEDLPDDESRATAKSVVSDVIDVVLAAVEDGKLDGGAIVQLQPKTFSAVLGGRCVQTAKLEGAFKKLVELAKKEPKFTGVKMDAATFGGVRFHTTSLPIDEDDDAAEFLGDKLDVAVGFGPDSSYLAIGPGGLELARQVIEKSSGSPNTPVPPFQMTVGLGKIMEFAAAAEDNPVVMMLAEALKKTGGRDHITLKVTPISDGENCRLEIEEGVLEAIGKAAKAAAGGGDKF